MLHLKDVKITKELVISALYQVMNPLEAGASKELVGKFVKAELNIRKAFDIVIREMKAGGIQ